MNCSECKYSCERNYDTSWKAENSISANLDLICMYDKKTDSYVNKDMVCKHFSDHGGINWNERRKREYPIRKV